MTVEKEFTCACCGVSDGQAKAEMRENFPGVPEEECSLVCEDCYRLLFPH